MEEYGKSNNRKMVLLAEYYGEFAYNISQNL